MNRMLFQDLVKGNYGRKVAYADVSEITEENTETAEENEE